MRTTRNDWKLVAGVLAISFLAFANALDGEFVYDDRFQILKNPTITSLGNIPSMFTESVWQFLSRSADEPIGSYYRPIFNIALILNYGLFGLEPFGWHLVSVLLHLAVTFGVFALAREWDLTSELAAIAALLFGLHPVHVESVAWISGLPDPLLGVFTLGAVALYEVWRREGAAWRLGVSLALAALALLTKEVAIVIPVFVGVRELVDAGRERSLAARVTDAARRAAPYAALAALYLGARYAVLGFISKTEPKAAGIAAEQVMWTVPDVLLHYVELLFVPYPLAITYDLGYVASAADPRFWGALAALVAIAAVAVWLAWRAAAARYALAFLVLFLLPVLNLKAFNQDESLVHDRYLYLPSVGFCILVALGLGWLAERVGTERRRTALVAAACAIAAVFFGLTVAQNRTWNDDLTMARHALAHDPDKPFLLNYVGAYYMVREQNFAEAERWLERAVELRPDYFDSLTNLADVYRFQRRLVEAEQTYRRALDAGSPYFSTPYNLGLVYIDLGRRDEAREWLERALEIDARNAEALYTLGWIYDQGGDRAAAERYYVRALEARPTYPEPRINLAVSQTQTGRHKDALENLLVARRIAPQHPVLLYALGDVYARTGKYREAAEAFTQLVRVAPTHHLAWTQLGLCYERLGDRANATASFRRAVEVAPNEPYTDVARSRLR